ncbi:transcriptional regulator [Cellulomonas sp. ICMP 17802]|uniref:transcriptional regulator n=1 Tax=Cellulomonas sp. ICMP 17802 TaxID=3239199 RepID=UPI00351B5AF9
MVAQDFGIPPTGATVAENLALWVDEAQQEGNAESMRVPWRGGWDVLTVVSVPVNQLYLNPNTHRIRAQRTSDPARDEALGRHPWGEEGQQYLRDLLRSKPTEPNVEDPEYRELVTELGRHGQRDPGIVTRTGILVDANTRCVALRDLGVTHIRVGVLKHSANWEDINAIELQIQLRKDKRRDYPYINRLISIEEQLAAGMSERDVAHDWNIAEKSLKADMWAYALIREAIDRSRTSDGAQLNLLHFNDQQESFREFHRGYQALLATDPDGAEQMREARLASLVLGLPKTSLRAVGGEFYTRYLERQLPPNLKPTVPEPTAIAIPGLPGVGTMAPASSDGARAARALTDSLLQARAQTATSEAPGSKAAAAKFIDEANQAFRRATKLAGQDETLAKKQTAVPDRVVDASDFLNQATTEFAKSRQERTLDEDAFDSALLELRSSIEGLAKLASRAYPSPPQGVGWLLAAARARADQDV